jgi:hypothetical protein
MIPFEILFQNLIVSPIGLERVNIPSGEKTGELQSRPTVVGTALENDIIFGKQIVSRELHFTLPALKMFLRLLALFRIPVFTGGIGDPEMKLGIKRVFLDPIRFETAVVHELSNPRSQTGDATYSHINRANLQTEESGTEPVRVSVID